MWSFRFKMNRSLKKHNVQLLVTKQRQHCAYVYSHICISCDTLIVVAVTNFIYCDKLYRDTIARMCFYNSTSPLIPYLHVIKLDKHVSNELTLILQRSHTGTVWFYTSTSNKRAA